MSQFLERINLSGFLSFSDERESIPLTPLNVMIGPNGSGKSNLVEAFSILRATPKDLDLPFRRGGRIKDWIWQGTSELRQSTIEVICSSKYLRRSAKSSLCYQFSFDALHGTLRIREELLWETADEDSWSFAEKYLTREKDQTVLLAGNGIARKIDAEDIDPAQSILRQRRDPDLYPELSRIAAAFERIRIYRGFQSGPDSNLKNSSRADARTDFLEENFENLPGRLATIKRNPSTKRRLLALLNDLAPGFDDLEVVPEGGALQLYLIEGDRTVPAHRLSDGTLRYLCLLAILLDPGPTSFLVIEEPELGLHPDALVGITNLIIEMSKRTQILVTTHSSQMLDALTDHADSVLVCEKPEDRTRITRLKQEDIDVLKDRGGLGWLWMRGHLGGTRW